MSSIDWISHPDCARHEMGPGHPESSQRLLAIEARLASAALASSLVRLQAPLAFREVLARVHDASMIERVLSPVPEGSRRQLDPDTAMTPHSAAAALRAAGAVQLAVERLIAGESSRAFCAVRPPGHHAERSRPMGFCLFNNIAVGAAQALASGIERVAILDFDVHYGNGSADIFRDHPGVLVCNTYQQRLYPFWPGAGGSTNLIDAPLPAYADGAAFRAAVESLWAPAIDAFQPELILVSAGFDAHADDPLAQLLLEAEDYAWIGRWIADRARHYAGNRVAATLEGGYNGPALAASVEAFMTGLSDSV